jgi:hypothetical protein
MWLLIHSAVGLLVTLIQTRSLRSIRTITKPYSSLKPMVGTTNKSIAAIGRLRAAAGPDYFCEASPVGYRAAQYHKFSRRRTLYFGGGPAPSPKSIQSLSLGELEISKPCYQRGLQKLEMPDDHCQLVHYILLKFAALSSANCAERDCPSVLTRAYP